MRFPFLPPIIMAPADSTRGHRRPRHSRRGHRRLPALCRPGALLARLVGRLRPGRLHIRRFDLPLLVAEFARASIAFSLEGRVVLDIKRLLTRHLTEYCPK